MGFVSIIKHFAQLAFGNPLCDGLETRVLSCEENIAIQHELLEEDQKLLKEEEELFKVVTELQNNLFLKACALEVSQNRAVKILEDGDARLNADQITEIAKRLVKQIEVNHQDIVDDMAKVDESFLELDRAKIQMGQAFKSSDKIKYRR